MRFAVLVLGAMVAALALAATGAGAQGRPRHAKLDSRLATVADSFEAGGAALAADEAARNGVKLSGDRVRVIIEADDANRAADAAKRAGGTLERRHGDLLQFELPVAALRRVAASGGVRLVRPPLQAVPLATGEGVALINADDWHAQGLTGVGVTLAILDLGFAGYNGLLGGELPASVTVQSFRQDADITGGGIDHGTRVAEIAHEVAPDATMYLVNFDTETELAAASAWLTSEGVDVINASWGYLTSGPGDGTGVVDDIVTTSVNGGTFWAVAAGNHAERHWAGAFQDSDADLYHEFQASPQDEGNEIFVVDGDTVNIELRWDDPFGAACRDYDLYLVDIDGGMQHVRALSENEQYDGTNCVFGADPVEVMSHVVSEGGFGFDTYHVLIKKFFAPTNAQLDLLSSAHDFEYTVTAGSLLQPADNPNVTTVGAVYWGSPNALEAFSSRGPNENGVIKPDVVAPDGVTTSAGAFFGTSGASPHVAGAAALVAQTLSCLSPAELGAYLESGAVDLGAAGKDNSFGAGRVLFGATPPDLDGDGIADDCDADLDGDGCANLEEAGPQPSLGGDRDESSPWDFYSVPIPALHAAPDPTILFRDGDVTASDAQSVFAYARVAAETGTTEYEADLNLNGVKDGIEYDRTPSTTPGKPWRSGPPDGAITALDAQVAFIQVGHHCAGP